MESMVDGTFTKDSWESFCYSHIKFSLQDSNGALHFDYDSLVPWWHTGMHDYDSTLVNKTLV